ncbi:MAG: gamma-glutamylcyclotransferase [Proteobacteria bacterium]|nr:gamma-glutamylcyclotransferase [Pseudomonadota bacterium]
MTTLGQAAGVRGRRRLRSGAMNDQPPIALTREAILSGKIHDMIKHHAAAFEMRTEAERIATLDAMFDGEPIREDVWLFAYGSLIWNPAIHFAEQRCVTVRGYHRKFCLEVHLGRGSPEAPGLMLGLDRGGSCRGVALRIPAARAREELEVVWQREMVGTAYTAKWLGAAGNGGPIRAIGFVVDRAHDRYVGGMEEQQAAALIAGASGFLGPCADYLRQTSSHLTKLGIPDSGLRRLQTLVDKLQRETPV